MKQLTTDPYKGTRDFYPEDMALQKYIFDTMRRVAEQYGYQEYTASVMEETDLYRAKTGEEIVTEQTYTFTDRGGRDVTLRPEMTPTVARMVARKRRDLSFPVRWYSIPNCFRYERPQRGRLREFWQLNVDLLGSASLFADSEIIKMAYDIMVAFGADPATFVVKINSRTLMNTLFKDVLRLDKEQTYRLSKLIDKKAKVSAKEFLTLSQTLTGTKQELFLEFLNATTLDNLPDALRTTEAVTELRTIMNTLVAQGVQNCLFDPTLMRGFDYYTGSVFEVFDTSPKNSRSLFGGGRYDNLVDLFGVASVPAVGFGMGDVTMQDYLKTYHLTPSFTSEIDLTICTLDDRAVPQALTFAESLRKQGKRVVVDYSEKKIGQKSLPLRKTALYAVCIGDQEIATDTYTLKTLADFSEQQVSGKELATLTIE